MQQSILSNGYIDVNIRYGVSKGYERGKGRKYTGRELRGVKKKNKKRPESLLVKKKKGVSQQSKRKCDGIFDTSD